MYIYYYNFRFIFSLLNQMIRHKVSREVNICAISQSGKHDDLVEIIGIIYIFLLI
jgi:hypothetical protein